VTHAGYAYCQLRDTELSVQFRHGHGPRATSPWSVAPPSWRCMIC